MKNLFSALQDPLDYKPDWQSMSGKEKAGYIWTYYKVPIVILCVILYLAGSAAWRYAVRIDPILYVGTVNITAGEAMEKSLTDDYIAWRENPDSGSRDAVVLDGGMFLSSDPAGSYLAARQAAQVKITAGISTGQLDIVLMDQDAFDLFSSQHLLLNLDEAAQLQDLKADFVENTAVLEDNSDGVYLDPDTEYRAVTEKGSYGLDVSGSAILQQAGLEGPVYLGVIINTKRMEEVISYIRYLREG